MKAAVKKSLRLWMPILLVSLLLALFSGSVFAEDADPGDTWWSLNLETGILSIEEDIPQYDTSVFIFPPWYEWSSDITEVRIAEGVERIGQCAFTDCKNIERVTLPSSLTFIGGYAFACCEKLTTVTIPAKVETIETYSFEGDSGLTKFLVDKNNPYFSCDAQGVLYTKDKRELLICPGGLTGTLVIPQGVTTLAENSIANCCKLTEVLIPNSVTMIGRSAFSCSDALTHISLPDSVKMVDDYAFYFCTNLKTVDLAKAELVSMDVFEGCSNLEQITVSQDNPYYTWDEQGALYNKDMTSLFRCPMGFRGSFVIPKGVEIISYEAFQECMNLTAVEIPEGVTSIQAYAFYCCSSLKNLTIPNSVRSIEDSVFAYCGALTDITLPKGLTELMYSVFEECISLKTIELPDTLTAIPYYAFKGCTALERVSLPDQLTFIEPYAFSGCFSLKSIELPQTLKEVGGEAFYSCFSLKNLVLPYGLEGIGDGAFFYCRALQSLYIPDSVKDLGWSLLYGCESLSSLILPSCVTDLEALDLGECDALKAIYLRGPAPVQEYIYLPDGVTLYYIEGQEGWTTPLWEGYNTKTWSGYWATDVKKTDYFYEPVQWALDEGITTGVGKDLFRPENTCTRAQVVTFLWRAKGCPEPTTTENPFKDISPKDYYYKAVLWAAEQEITTGVTKDRFAPEEGCTRAQIVTFLWRAEGEPQNSNVQNPFKDIEEDTYYSHAVLWAVEQGITTGKTKDKFAPEDLCTRGQVVTFLWRVKNMVPEYYALYYPVLQSLIEKQDSDFLGQGIFYDLDGNGVDECIYMYRTPNGHDTKCAVFTVQDGEAVALLEDHSFAWLVGGNLAALALTEVEGQTYLCTYARYYDGGHSEEYEYIDYMTYVWEFYLLTNNELILTDEYKYICTEGYNGEEWVLIPEKSAFIANGEELPLQELESWKESIHILGILDGRSNGDEYDCGYSCEELLNICKP